MQRVSVRDRRFETISLKRVVVFSFSSDNQLIGKLAEAQNRATKEKQTSLADIQSMWNTLSQLGEQLNLALVKIDREHFRSKQRFENRISETFATN